MVTSVVYSPVGNNVEPVDGVATLFLFMTLLAPSPLNIIGRYGHLLIIKTKC